MLTTVSEQTLNYLPDVDAELTADVLASLERTQRRTDGHFTNQRRTHRFAYTPTVTVRTIVALRRRGKEEEFCEASFLAYARNLSQGGIGFVFAPRYVPQLVSDDAVILRAEEVIAVKKPLDVALPGPNGSVRWVVGRVVRRRVIQHGYLDCGMCFEV